MHINIYYRRKLLRVSSLICSQHLDAEDTGVTLLKILRTIVIESGVKSPYLYEFIFGMFEVVY